MTHYTLTNAAKISHTVVYDLLADGAPVMTAVPYADAFAHVLANGADADTYQEDHMSTPEAVAVLREQKREQDEWFAQH